MPVISVLKFETISVKNNRMKKIASWSFFLKPGVLHQNFEFQTVEKKLNTIYI